jgi:hypothetical protein
MVKMQYGVLGFSSRVLLSKTSRWGRQWRRVRRRRLAVQRPMASTSPTSHAAVRVIVRVRPQLSSEDDEPCVFLDGADGAGRGSVRLVERSEGLTGPVFAESAFKFDACYGPEATQEQIFEREVRLGAASTPSGRDAFALSQVQPLLPAVLRGLSATVFCCGMTGTGKTFTMQGSKSSAGGEKLRRPASI